MYELAAPLTRARSKNCQILTDHSPFLSSSSISPISFSTKSSKIQSSTYLSKPNSPKSKNKKRKTTPKPQKNPKNPKNPKKSKSSKQKLFSKIKGCSINVGWSATDWTYSDLTSQSIKQIIQQRYFGES